MSIIRYKDGAGVVQNYTPGTAVAAGVAVQLGSIIGITHAAIAANVLGALDMDGCFRVVKTTNEAAFAQGAHVYLDVPNQLAKDTSNGGAYPIMGYAAEAATAAATEVKVELIQLPA